MSISSLNTQKLFNYLYLFIVIIFSFTINWNYAKLGVFPMDTFLHYDSGYKILNGELPIRDYWIVSGLFVDFLQAFFFQIFGINWYAYIIHSSLLNLAISVLTFQILIKLKLKSIFAFFYTISFSLLAYPISGTPFLDLHATFFSVISFYLLILALENLEKKKIWFLIVLFFYLSFLSKQVPAAYLIIIYTLIITPYFLVNRFYKQINIIIFSIIFFLIFTIFFLKFLNIDFGLFYTQYIDYPRNIGSGRIEAWNISAESFFNKYKFILIPVLILLVIKLKKIFVGKIKIFSNEIIIFLLFLSLVGTLIFHQLLTKNQIYIYFLIPLSFALLHIEVEKLNIKFKSIFTYIILILVLASTTKYHLRFNETRKFHELENTDISKYADSGSLHKSLKGNLWISPFYDGDSKDELNMLKQIKEKFDKTKKNVMLITHYLFLDSIIKIKLNSPSRTHTLDGASIPTINDKHFEYYKNFFKKIMINEKIEEIYFIKIEKISTKIVTNLINEKCYSKFEDEVFIFFTINKDCKD